jgi:hypothetical protein
MGLDAAQIFNIPDGKKLHTRLMDRLGLKLRNQAFFSNKPALRERNTVKHVTFGHSG